MIQYRNGIITSDAITIGSTSTTLTLSADVDCAFVGALRLGNGAVRSFGFVKVGALYSGVLKLRINDKKHIGSARLSVIATDATGQYETNSIPVSLDAASFDEAVDIAASQEILALRRDLAQTQALVDKLSSGKSVGSFKLAEGTRVQPGMVPVALDSSGTFVAGFPFADVVKQVNGQRSADGCIVLDASMIQYAQEISLREFGERIAEAFDRVADQVGVLSQSVKALSKRVDGIEVQLLTHIDSGTI